MISFSVRWAVPVVYLVVAMPALQALFPGWLKFDARQRVFDGKPLGKLGQDLVIEETAVPV